MVRRIILLSFFISFVYSFEKCPTSSSGIELNCGTKCCQSSFGDYFCCNAEDNGVITRTRQNEGYVYTPSSTSWELKFDWNWLLIGIAISIILTAILSLLCCLLCNGCDIFQRREYTVVNRSRY